MTYAIRALGLTKHYGDEAVVDDLSFEVPWNRVTGFLGPNGAGKTTTMRMILGLARPTSGHSEVMGRPFTELDRPSRVAGVLLETQQFHPQRTGRDHLRIYAAASEIDDHRVPEVLALVELERAANKKVGGYSLGMKQRLGLAAALLAEPRILILDEPANGLDPSGMKWLRAFLRDFASSPERSVFVSSHLLAEISLMADEVVVIDHGRLVTHSEVADLIHRSQGSIHVRTEEPERLRGILVASGHEAELTSHDSIVVRRATQQDVGRAAAAAGIVLLELDSDEGTLEDIFLELTGREVRP
jgi:ABC-2 type transport system ATP-binding protein